MSPALPTYQNAAALLERKNGAGLRLVGWTVARSALIAVGMFAAGVKPGKAIAGSLLASALITTAAVCMLERERH